MSRDTYTKEQIWKTEIRQVAMKAAERLVTTVGQQIPGFQELGMVSKREVARLVANELCATMAQLGIYLAAGGGGRILGSVDKITLDGDKSKVVVQVRPGTPAVDLAALDQKQAAVVYTDIGTFDQVREELNKAVSAMQLDFIDPPAPDAEAVAAALGKGKASVAVGAQAAGTKQPLPDGDGSLAAEPPGIPPPADSRTPPPNGPTPESDAKLDEAIGRPPAFVSRGAAAIDGDMAKKEAARARKASTKPPAEASTKAPDETAKH